MQLSGKEDFKMFNLLFKIYSLKSNKELYENYNEANIAEPILNYIC